MCVHSDRALVCGCLKSLCVLCASVLPCLLISVVCFNLLFVQILVSVFVGVRFPIETAEMGETLV